MIRKVRYSKSPALKTFSAHSSAGSLDSSFLDFLKGALEPLMHTWTLFRISKDGFVLSHVITSEPCHYVLPFAKNIGKFLQKQLTLLEKRSASF